MNRTLLDDFFRVAGKTTWYERIEQIQTDLDRFLAFYNLDRATKATGSRGEPRSKLYARP